MKKQAGTAFVLGLFAAAMSVGCAAGSSGGESDGSVDSDGATGSEQEAIIAAVGGIGWDGCNAVMNFSVQSQAALSSLAVNSGQLSTQDVAVTLFAVNQSGTTQLATQAQNISSATAQTLNQMVHSLASASNVTTADHLAAANTVTTVDQFGSVATHVDSTFVNDSDTVVSHQDSAFANQSAASAQNLSAFIVNGASFNQINALGPWLMGGGLASSQFATSQNASSAAASTASTLNAANSLVDAASTHNSGATSQNSSTASHYNTTTATSSFLEDHAAATNASLAENLQESFSNASASTASNLVASTSANTQAFTHLEQAQTQHYIVQVRMDASNISSDTLQIYAQGANNALLGTAVFTPFFGTCGVW